jgi:peptidyl-dipeptidase A
MDLDKDVRSLMSVEPNADWWETVLHELGHIYYYMSYTNDNVPPLLRSGANRAYHEAIGTLIGLASLQKPFLVQYGLVDSAAEVDQTQVLLREALNYVIVIPWGAGVMTAFEDALYAGNLPKDQYNAKWWELKKTYQGIVPPYERGEEYCDAASKTHISNDAAQYYDYAISYILLFQFHMHIAKDILKQDPHNANYFGSKPTGKFLHDMMYPGASVDWREHLHNMIGTEMSATAMLEYFAPLMEYLRAQNAGRTHTLPESL